MNKHIDWLNDFINRRGISHNTCPHGKHEATRAALNVAQALNASGYKASGTYLDATGACVFVRLPAGATMRFDIDFYNVQDLPFARADIRATSACQVEAPRDIWAGFKLEDFAC
tara:strand:- start:308 stop:649 length:342 start_codon:yes stop_codon:yes gene_type:complete